MSRSDSVTVHFKQDESAILADFLAEAQRKGYSKNEYARIVLLNHDLRKKFVLDADCEAIVQQYEGKLEILTRQLSELQNKILDQSQLQGIQSAEKKEVNISEEIKKGIDEHKKELLIERLQKESAAYIQEIEELENENDALEAALDEAEDEIKKLTESQGFINIVKEAAPSVLSGIVNSSPALQSAFGGGLGALQTTALADDDRNALDFGKNFAASFTSTERVQMQRIIDFLAAHKSKIEKTLAAITNLSTTIPAP